MSRRLFRRRSRWDVIGENLHIVVTVVGLIAAVIGWSAISIGEEPKRTQIAAAADPDVAPPAPPEPPLAIVQETTPDAAPPAARPEPPAPAAASVDPVPPPADPLPPPDHLAVAPAAPAPAEEIPDAPAPEAPSQLALNEIVPPAPHAIDDAASAREEVVVPNKIKPAKIAPRPKARRSRARPPMLAQTSTRPTKVLVKRVQARAKRASAPRRVARPIYRAYGLE